MLKNEQDIVSAIQQDRRMMEILKAVKTLELPDWWVCAGFVRSKIWDDLHGYSERTPLPDIDVIYFDENATEESEETKFEQQLRTRMPDLPWSVKNQARMHRINGLAPYRSSVDAISKFPETATALGVKLDTEEGLVLTAPCGIQDVLRMIVKPTPHFQTNEELAAIYESRLQKKDWKAKWPKVKVQPLKHQAREKGEKRGGTIKTARLEFRKYQDEDFDFLCSLLSDPEVVRFIGNGQTRSREGALEFLYWIYRSYRENPELGLRLLIRSEDDVPIGHAGLVKQTIEGREELEIGYWIAKDYWGQGYAAEAAAALRDYGTEQLGNKRLISLIQPENLGSRKVAERTGLALEKEIRLSGKDVCVYALETTTIEETQEEQDVKQTRI